jgi:uncharacterized membrane protein YkoI
MDYKNYSLGKMADKLVKAMEAKEHFDKKEVESNYIRKVQTLKEILTQEYKFATENKAKHSNYAVKLEVIEKHIDYVKKIQNRKTFDQSDKQIIDRLMLTYTSHN